MDGESPDSRRTLVGRLGYPADARLAIFNCDVLGASHAAKLASLEAMEKGVASSGTLMVPCPWAMEAVRLFEGKDVGVHIDDYAVALAPATKGLIERERVTTIGFRPIRDLQRAEARVPVS